MTLKWISLRSFVVFTNVVQLSLVEQSIRLLVLSSPGVRAKITARGTAGSPREPSSRPPHGGSPSGTQLPTPNGRPP